MIHELKAEDREHILSYIGREPEMNLFMIEDLTEFAKTYEGRREKSIQTAMEEMRAGGKTIMGGYRNGRLTAIPVTAAENTESAMIR